MALDTVSVSPIDAPPSARLQRFLADVDARLDQLVRDGLHERLPSFAPADYMLVHSTLAALARTPARGERFLEWGSALGAVTGSAAALGFRAAGIELDAELAAISRELLAAHGLTATITEGSFVPEGHEIPAHLDDPDTLTLGSGSGPSACSAYDDLGRDLDEFAIVYAYPWPDMVAAFLDLFDTHAAPGTLLVTYRGRDGCHIHRKS